jgi:hypothetical protein
MREIIRDYQAAIDTLTVVIDKEAQQGSPDSSERITPPKDNSEADALRERLSGLRAQVQPPPLKSSSMRKLSPGNNLPSRPPIRSSGVRRRNSILRKPMPNVNVLRYTCSWRRLCKNRSQPRHSWHPGVSTPTNLIFEPVRQTSERLRKHFPPADWTASSTRSARRLRSARSRTTRWLCESRSKTPKIPAASWMERFPASSTIDSRPPATKKPSGSILSSRSHAKPENSRLESPRPGQAWRPRRSSACMEDNSGCGREQIRRYLQTAQARLDELKSQPKAKDPQTNKLEAMRLELVQQRVDQVREVSSFFEMMLTHAETMRAESSQLLKLSSVSERVSQGFAEIGSRVENILGSRTFHHGREDPWGERRLRHPNPGYHSW